MSGDRTITYAEAIRDAQYELMSRDERVVLFGLDMDDPKACFETARGLPEAFGPERVFGTPLSEDAMTGAAIGMALAGLHPIYNHYRMDFSLLSMNQMINVAAKTHAMSGGAQSVPMTMRVLIGKSWGQGAQHSQSLYPLFMNIPGIRMAAPTTPYDAKACLTWLVEDENPGIMVEHRLCYFQRGPVPEGRVVSEFGKARIVREGSDVTIVGISYQNIEAWRAASYLESVGISAEVIDPIWLNPLDIDTIAASVAKTGILITVDNAWRQCGAGAEITARLHEQGIPFVSRRMAFAETPCPTTPTLEAVFYPDAIAIAHTAARLVEPSVAYEFVPRDDLKHVEFRGPF